MQFGLSTRTKTENHSVQFTWSNSNKRFPDWAKENKHSLYWEDEYFASLFHFGKRCASHSIYCINLTSLLFLLFQSSFNLTWIEERFLVSVTNMFVSRCTENIVRPQAHLSHPLVNNQRLRQKQRSSPEALPLSSYVLTTDLCYGMTLEMPTKW